MTHSPPKVEALAQTINSLRTAQGISKSHLAELVGVSEPTFRRKLRGWPKPLDILEFVQIADELGIDPADLMRIYAGRSAA